MPSKLKAPKVVLTEAQKRMYASEKLMNFRWIAKTVASYSAYTLSDKDLVSRDTELDIAELGEFCSHSRMSCANSSIQVSTPRLLPTT